jgi:hypothetical protein
MSKGATMGQANGIELGTPRVEEHTVYGRPVEPAEYRVSVAARATSADIRGCRSVKGLVWRPVMAWTTDRAAAVREAAARLAALAARTGAAAEAQATAREEGGADAS